MKFGDIPTGEAAGAILAHSVRQDGLVLKKGHRLAADDIAALRRAGLRTVVAAVLEDGDVHEDTAATRLAAALTRDAAAAGLTVADPFTGRVNIFAAADGVAVLDDEVLRRVNLVDETITVATLPRFEPVSAGQMVATVKIIPFAVTEQNLSICEAMAAAAAGPAIRVAAYRPRDIGLIQTRMPGTSPKMLDKTAVVTAERVAQIGSTLTAERRCAHTAKTLAGEIRSMVQAGRGMVLIAGASAITDRRDVLPAAIEAAGGTVDHLGMPVDPGNLLLLGRIGSTPVLGLPGCARSPKLNGLDWVLQRLAADLPVTGRDIMGMGIGGLLTEIPLRGQPRDRPAPAAPRPARVAALVLAAGQSRRMGARNKLTAEVDGQPMVTRAVDAVLATPARPVIVVTGHEADEIEAALAGRDVTLVHNPDYADGLSTSLKTGLEAVPGEVDGVLICLGDMPRLSAEVLRRLIEAYAPDRERCIVVPTHDGKRGNPVLWDRRFFEEMKGVAGDVGARHMIGAYADMVVEVEMAEPGVLLDIDTPEALAALGRTKAAP
ncbi:MAG: NTP transferase domain-containing protein [Inquilinaceae bacterium]